MDSERIEPTDVQHNRPTGDTSNGSHPPANASGRGWRDSRLIAAEKETRRLARSHYENFLVGSILLPRRLRQPFYNVYAFCRSADDLADESASTELAERGLAAFQQALDAIYAGSTSEGLFVALAHTIEQFRLPKQPFDDLLDAFRQDQRKTGYRTIAELLDYCRRSANSVGRTVLIMAGCDDEQNRRWSDSICTGLQLANFLQDVSSDYQRGRIYLATDEMNRFDVDPSMFTQRPTPRPMRILLSHECARAETYLKQGLKLADRVPGWFASDVRLFAHGGLATLDAIRRIDFDVLRVRPTVSRRRQLWLLGRAGLRML